MATIKQFLFFCPPSKTSGKQNKLATTRKKQNSPSKPVPSKSTIQYSALKFPSDNILLFPQLSTSTPGVTLSHFHIYVDESDDTLASVSWVLPLKQYYPSLLFNHSSHEQILDLFIPTFKASMSNTHTMSTINSTSNYLTCSKTLWPQFFDLTATSSSLTCCIYKISVHIYIYIYTHTYTHKHMHTYMCTYIQWSFIYNEIIYIL